MPAVVPKNFKCSPNWLRGFKRRVAAAGVPLIPKRIHVRSSRGPTRVEYQVWLQGLWKLINDIGLNKEDMSMGTSTGSDDMMMYIQSRVINVDECGIDRPDPSSLRCMVAPYQAAALAVTKDNQWTHISFVGIIDAAGGRSPPYMILKGTHGQLTPSLLERVANTPRDTGYTISSKGYQTGVTWLELLKFIHAWKNPTKASPIIIITDGHSTRYNIQSLQWARENDVHIYCMLPNCTSVCQPLDVGVFDKFKHYVKKYMNECISSGVGITRTNSLPMLIKAHEAAFTIDNIRRAWCHTAMGTFSPIPDTSMMRSDAFAPDDRTPILPIASQSPSPQVNNIWQPPNGMNDILASRSMHQHPSIILHIHAYASRARIASLPIY